MSYQFNPSIHSFPDAAPSDASDIKDIGFYKGSSLDDDSSIEEVPLVKVVATKAKKVKPSRSMVVAEHAATIHPEAIGTKRKAIIAEPEQVFSPSPHIYMALIHLI
jgi:hypothetical protein